MFGLLSSEKWTRQGAARYVPAGTRVYAVGDVHGRLDLLCALKDEIRRDRERREREPEVPQRTVLIYLGDYVDRGPQSAGVVEELLARPLEGFETVHLIGNHEAFLLEFLETPVNGQAWLMNGADATFRSYGIDPWGAPPGDRLAWLQRQFLRALPEAHRSFLESLSLCHEEGDYYFVHAGVRPDVPLEAQSPDDLLWIRQPFLASRSDFGKVVVHGHTPVEAPELKPNRIAIDTGAVYGGRLTALVLEEERRGFLQV